MKRLLRLGRKRNLFIAHSRAATFCLLFALTALVMAQTPTRTASTTSQLAATVVPPFVGDHSETWEEFPVQKFGSSVVSILGGIATVSGYKLEIAGTGMFRMCEVYAEPSDGARFMGANAGNDLVTISFSQPVSAFGAYWGGLDCGGYFPDITFTFFDANGNQVGTDLFSPCCNGRPMDWRGYTFDRPVKTITYKGDFPVTDGMQVNASNVNLKITSIAHPATNTIHLNCLGVPNAINRIESSPDLSPGSFNTLASVMASANGAFQYDDTSAGTKKFYRVAYP